MTTTDQRAEIPRAEPHPTAAPAASSADALDWSRDGVDWPNRATSRFVEAGGLTWHVQVAGSGPVALLLHGTGAATHSWAGLLPLLSRHFTVVAPDLPGHGFTRLPRLDDLSLPGMSGAVAALLARLELRPALAVGHSAGAAILIRMALDGRAAPAAIVSLNGALLPFSGLGGLMFPQLARLLFLNPLSVRFFAWRASDRTAVVRLLEGTGSKIAPSAVDLYARLFRSERHLTATLGMMANWDLPGLERDLPRLAVPLVLVAASGDLTIPAEVAFKVRERVPGATVELYRGVGHLAHEERPEVVAEAVVAAARRHGVLPAA